MLCPSVTCAVRSANRTHCAGHIELYTRPPGEPIRSKFIIQPTFCPSAGSAHPPQRFRTGFHSRSHARGGLVRSTARTLRSLLCKSGAVPEIATAAARPLSLVRCRLRRHSTNILLRVTTRTQVNITLGHAVACSRIPTVISISYRSLTHSVSLTHTPLHTHTVFHPHKPFPSHTWFSLHTAFH